MTQNPDPLWTDKTWAEWMQLSEAAWAAWTSRYSSDEAISFVGQVHEVFAEVVKLRAALSKAQDYEAVCCCGMKVSEHGPWENHTPHAEMPCPNLAETRRLQALWANRPKLWAIRIRETGHLLLDPQTNMPGYFVQRADAQLVARLTSVDGDVVPYDGLDVFDPTYSQRPKPQENAG